MTYDSDSWALQMSSFTLDSIDLMTAPPVDPVDDDKDPLTKILEEYTGATLGDETFPVYGHFNSGYPFLGFDEYTGDLVEEDLRIFRPDIECPDAERDPSDENPWNACYY